jgi:6-pyruvoyltetrahydropterin/6-carboxytetrahydropterin synthase
MRLSLTRTVRFRAVHRLARSDWTAEENRRRFGWTAEPHSHEYTCAVTVTGPVDERQAQVMDLAALDRILESEVVRRLDGKTLHRDLPEFAETLTTCEALARDLFRRIGARLPDGVTLSRVRVAEDSTLYAECGDDA